MLIHPIVVHLNSIVNVTLQASFDGSASDPTDKARISAYGDPKVNMGGSYVDPHSPFTFNMMAAEYWKGITTEMNLNTAKFMTQLPAGLPGQPAPKQGPLDCITSDPVLAATLWTAAVQVACGSSMTALRAKTPPQLSTLPDASV